MYMKVMREANLLLFFSGISLLGVSVWHHFYNDNIVPTVLFYVLEAAFVGAVADWFAVTALFKQPFGIKTHTELIHRDREAFIKNAADTVQNELVKINLIKASLRDIDFTTLFLDCFNNHQHRRVALSYLCSIALDEVRQADFKGYAQILSDELKESIKDKNLASLIGKLAQQGLKSGIIDQLINFGLEKAIQRPCWKDDIYNLLENHLGFEKIFIDTRDAAATLTPELITILNELSRENSPMRKMLNTHIRHIIDNLNTNQQWSESVGRWRNEVLTNVDFKPFIDDCLNQARDLLLKYYDTTKSENIEETDMGRWLDKRLIVFCQNLKQNDERRNIYNKHIRVVVSSFINEEKNLIGEVVTTALSAKSKEDMNEFVLGIAGEDLAWIRQNGTYFGAVVGSIVFLVGYYIVDPYLGPLIRFLFGLN